VGPGVLTGRGEVDPVGALALVLSAMAWATGSVYARHARLPESPLLATGMEMLAGGALLLVAAVATGGAHVRLDAVTLRSALALLYLIVFGSLVAFTAYIWLLKVAPPARVSTYAYVNPVVAVLLGWAVLDEPLTPRTGVAAGVIVAAVAVITVSRAGQEPGSRK
jgi:drug/metabolite transporter (DMT)-like permease